MAEDHSGELKKVVKSEAFHLNWSRGWLQTFALANWNCFACGGSLKAADYDLTKMKLEVAVITHAKLLNAAQKEGDAATVGIDVEVRLLKMIISEDYQVSMRTKMVLFSKRLAVSPAQRSQATSTFN